VYNDGTGSWRVGGCGLGNKSQTGQSVRWDAMVRPISVVILVDDSLGYTLLSTHQTTIPLSIDYNTYTAYSLHCINTEYLVQNSFWSECGKTKLTTILKSQ